MSLQKHQDGDVARPHEQAANIIPSIRVWTQTSVPHFLWKGFGLAIVPYLTWPGKLQGRILYCWFCGIINFRGDPAVATIMIHH